MDSPESHKQALHMLDAFTSVGVPAFALTFLDIDRKKAEYRPAQTLPQIRPALDYLLRHAADKHLNLIVRPHQPEHAMLVQLDDIDAKAVARVHDLAFLTVMTSPNNYQSWVAVQGADAELARRFRKGMGADVNASGAVRLAGTVNYKAAYRPLFPIVSLVSAQPGRIVTPQEIAPFLAQAEPAKWAERVSAGRPKRWPDYARILAGAPPNRSGTGPDVSRADYLWCRVSAQWRWSADEIAAKLMELSPKAKREGERYAKRTAEAAVKTVNQR